MQHFTEAVADWAPNVMGIPKLTAGQDEKVQQDAKLYVDQQQEQPKQQHKQQDEEEDCPPLSLDRANHLRKDEKALLELEQHPDAQFVMLKNSTHCLFRRSTSSTTTTTNQLAFLSKVPDSWGPNIFRIEHCIGGISDLCRRCP